MNWLRAVINEMRSISMPVRNEKFHKLAVILHSTILNYFRYASSESYEEMRKINK